MYTFFSYLGLFLRVGAPNIEMYNHRTIRRETHRNLYSPFQLTHLANVHETEHAVEKGQLLISKS